MGGINRVSKRHHYVQLVRLGNNAVDGVHCIWRYHRNHLYGGKFLTDTIAKLPKLFYLPKPLSID